MKLSTVLTSSLAALATASPAPSKREASPQPPSLLDIILDKLNLPDIPLATFNDFKQCMSTHDTFHTDYTRAADGEFSITDVDQTCCEKAKGIWEEIPDGQYGNAVFTEPCDGATVTGVSQQHMRMLRGFFDSV